MPANVATNFADSKKRAIRLSDKGTYYVKTTDGKRSYGPKAAFRKTTAGSVRKLRVGSAVPSKIKRVVRSNKGAVRGPAAGPRKPRSNRGVARGPQQGVVQRRMNRNFKRIAARPAGGPRKPRANKGVARGPREGALRRVMNTESKRMRARGQAVRGAVKRVTALKTPTEAELYQMIFGTPKKRKPAAKKPVARKSPAKKASPLRMMLRSRTVKK